MVEPPDCIAWQNEETAPVDQTIPLNIEEPALAPRAVEGQVGRHNSFELKPQFRVRRRKKWRCNWLFSGSLRAGVTMLVILVFCVVAGLLYDSAPAVAKTVFIIRHGDMVDSYPKCNASDVLAWNSSAAPCSDERYGNNAPLTACGVQEAKANADLIVQSHVSNLYSSPFVRCMQSARELSLQLHLDSHYTGTLLTQPFFAEDDNPPDKDGAYYQFPANAELLQTLGQETDNTHEEEDYGKSKYLTRMLRAVAFLVEEVTKADGNIAVYTHAKTSLSLAWGLCSTYFEENGGGDKFLEEFAKTPNFASAGYLRITFEDGHCRVVTSNTAAHTTSECSPNDAPPKVVPPEDMCELWPLEGCTTESASSLT